MILLTDEQTKKLELIDTIINALTINDILQLAPSEMVVDKLKGTESSKSAVLGMLINELKNSQNATTSLEMRYIALESDFNTLMKCLARPGFDQQSSYDFQQIKQRRNIY